MRVDGDSLEGASLPIGRGMLVSIVMDLEFSMVEPRASSILPGPGVLLIRQTRSLKVNLEIEFRVTWGKASTSLSYI
jgi:hypothetical protein